MIFQAWPLAFCRFGTTLLRKDANGKRFGGFAIGPFVAIDPKYIDDEGLLQHEFHHVRRFWIRLLTLRWWPRSWETRYQEELESYTIQLKYTPGAEFTFARYLSSRYGFPITYSRALRDLYAEAK